MKSLPTRGLLLTLAVLSVLAIAAAPAHARLTSGGLSDFSVSGTASNSVLNSGGLAVTCGRSTFTGTIQGGVLGSGALDFLNGTGATCRESVLGTSCTVVTTGRLTLSSTGSVAGVRATFTAHIDADFRATITCLGRRITVTGRQDLGSCVTFEQAPQTLIATNCPLRDSTGSSTFSGTYRSTHNPPITVSG